MLSNQKVNSYIEQLIQIELSKNVFDVRPYDGRGKQFKINLHRCKSFAFRKYLRAGLVSERVS